MKTLLKNRELSAFLAIVVLFAGLVALNPAYFSLQTLAMIFASAQILCLLALGATLVMLTRNIDVSVGSTVGLSAIATGVALNSGYGLMTAIAFALAIGALAGAFNGLLVVGLRIPAIVATLGTLGLYRGVMLLWTGGKWIEGLPNSLKALSEPAFIGISPLGWLVLALLLAGCASEKGIIDRDGYQLDTRHPAQAAYPRIKVLVIHYTADDFDVSLATLTDNQVSSHYLIPEKPPLHGGKPRIWQLVPEEELAWHAGVSFWRGSTRINDTSIGIELENRGWQKTAGVKSFTPFNPAQIDALIPLAKDIIARYHIAPQNVVAHADIAPQRKDDPGPLFPWRRLAEQGIGAWPDARRVAFYLQGRPSYEPVDAAALLDVLARYGYQVTPEMTPAQQKRVIMAFQMHFRPARWDGVADAQTLAIAEALLEKYGRG